MTNEFTSDTVRLSLLRYVKALYEACWDVDPPPLGKVYRGIKCTTVVMGPLSPSELTKKLAVGVMAGAERKKNLFPLKQNTLELIVEFSFAINQDDTDPPGIMAERVMGVIQQVIYDDDTLGGSVVMVDESTNEIDMITWSERRVRGMVKFDVMYRHSVDSVFDPNPNFTGP